MLWFGENLKHSLINPNQIRANGIPVYDDPFDHSNAFGVASDTVFIPFDTTGTIVHFESRVPNDWEAKHLPVILLTGETWNPSDEVMRHGNRSKEFMEMRTIRSLTSGVSKRAIHSMTTHLEHQGETDITLGQISEVYDTRNFCERLISTVNIAMAYRKDLDTWEEQRRVSGVISNDRHSAVTPEEVARKWNIGLETRRRL
jgi:hypothetical protein